jgi:LmbE family N-acetylglucosaminyl deacetylase
MNNAMETTPIGRLTAHGDGPRFTLVSFHAHPDDESLLTGGTLAKAAADGHRVVLVTATAGERGLAGTEDGHGDTLANVRLAELAAAAAALGCARVVTLGYGDSGLYPDPADADAFVHVDVDAAATRLADVLREEQADVLTIYDPSGGYGHPDHVQVHCVGAEAARLAGTPVVLEATVPGALFRWALLVLLVLRILRSSPGTSAPRGTHRVFAAPGAITHRVRVTDQLHAKRAAMAAHGSQRRTPGGTRVMDRFLRLPLPVFGAVFGHEWFIEQDQGPGRASGRVSGRVSGRTRGRREGDVFASLRTSASRGGA